MHKWGQKSGHIPLDHYDVERPTGPIFVASGFSHRAPIDFRMWFMKQDEIQRFRFFYGMGSRSRRSFIMIRAADIESNYVVSAEIFDDGRIRLLSNDEDEGLKFLKRLFGNNQFITNWHWINDSWSRNYFATDVKEALVYVRRIKNFPLGKARNPSEGRHVPLKDYARGKSELSLFRGLSMRNPIDFNFRNIDLREIQCLRFWYPMGPFNDSFVLLRIVDLDVDVVIHMTIHRNGNIELLSNDESKVVELLTNLFDPEQFIGISYWVDDRNLVAGFAAVISLLVPDDKLRELNVDRD